MIREKVLIITYYWPPNGGSGVQRWLKFVKYLPEMGYQPIVFTPENSSYAVADDSLLADIPAGTTVVRTPIWEPHSLFMKATASLGNKGMQQADFLTAGKKSFFQRISAWVRGNFFIPDARIFWVRPSVSFLVRYLREHGITKIVTTGPPHSLHLIGLRLKKKIKGLHWVADFRDPWSEWDMLASFSVTALALRRHRQLERKVLQTADRVITISPSYVKRFEELSGRKVDLITNGFDEADFNAIPRVRTGKFTIRHVGNIDELRDPRPAMAAIAALCRENVSFAEQVSIEFVGHVNAGFKADIARDPDLSPRTVFVDHLPHARLVSLYGSTDVQLLVLAHMALAAGNIPGKVFEYLASANPILAVGAAEGDVAQILRQAAAGQVYDRDDLRGMKQFLTTHFLAWQGHARHTTSNVSQFSRRALTEKVVAVLNSGSHK